jgi:outer membrane biosynthesis protein TonB
MAAPVETPPAPIAPVIETPIETPVSIPEPEPLELTEPVPAPAPEPAPVNQGARKGGKNAAFLKAAEKAARNRVLILADRSAVHVLKAAE